MHFKLGDLNDNSSQGARPTASKLFLIVIRPPQYSYYLAKTNTPGHYLPCCFALGVNFRPKSTLFMVRVLADLGRHPAPVWRKFGLARGLVGRDRLSDPQTHIGLALDPTIPKIFGINMNRFKNLAEQHSK